MLVNETALCGAFVIDLELLEDERGFFARSYCEREFAARGIQQHWVQCNVSYNRRRGTLRGMHYQAAPHEEVKLIRCTRGAVHDVIVDLRPGSPSYGNHVAVVLSAENRRSLYVPKGFAHGFLTLEDDTEVFYQMSAFYVADAARGFRYDDPAFSIPWPETIRVVSQRDKSYSDYEG